MGCLLNYSIVALMATSSKKLCHIPCLPGLLKPEPLCPWQATADPCLHRRHSEASLAQFLLGVIAPFPGSWYAQAFVCASECLWWVWGLILNMISPLLPSRWGFSFALRRGVCFFGGSQHSPVDCYSAASCNFDVLAGENERTSFYCAILPVFSERC